MRASQHVLVAAALAVALLSGAARAGDAAEAGRLTEELPTLKCLGVRWLVGGDANGNARVRVEYRKAGAGPWRRGQDLFRVETKAIRASARPPAGQTLHAGSVFDLAPATEYEVRLRLEDLPAGRQAPTAAGPRERFA